MKINNFSIFYHSQPTQIINKVYRCMLHIVRAALLMIAKLFQVDSSRPKAISVSSKKREVSVTSKATSSSTSIAESSQSVSSSSKTKKQNWSDKLDTLRKKLSQSEKHPFFEEGVSPKIVSEFMEIFKNIPESERGSVLLQPLITKSSGFNNIPRNIADLYSDQLVDASKPLFFIVHAFDSISLKEISKYLSDVDYQEKGIYGATLMHLLINGIAMNVDLYNGDKEAYRTFLFLKQKRPQLQWEVNHLGTGPYTYIDYEISKSKNKEVVDTLLLLRNSLKPYSN